MKDTQKERKRELQGQRQQSGCYSSNWETFHQKEKWRRTRLQLSVNMDSRVSNPVNRKAKADHICDCTYILQYLLKDLYATLLRLLQNDFAEGKCLYNMEEAAVLPSLLDQLNNRPASLLSWRRTIEMIRAACKTDGATTSYTAQDAQETITWLQCQQLKG